MSQLSMRQIIVLLMIIPALIVANIGGITTANIANAFDATNFFFPANYVFPTIWTTIYALMLFFGIWQALPAQRDNPRVERAAWIYGINLLLNAAWVLVFGQQMWLLSEVIIIGILITCALGYLALAPGNTSKPAQGERIAWIGAAIYFGWVSVATVANTSLLLITMNWDGFGIAPETWGAIMLVVAGVIGVAVAYKLREPVYLGVFLYAYIGVVVKQSGGASVVATTAVIGAVIFALILIARYINPLHRIAIPRSA